MIIENRIYIAARPDVVWAVTEDVERWPEWTPTVTRVSRVDDKPLREGSLVQIKQPGQPASEWEVTKFIPGESFVWETSRAGLSMVASHTIITEGTGTANILRIEANGIMAVIFWPVFQLAVRWALSKENQGLKARCEALSRSALTQ